MSILGTKLRLAELLESSYMHFELQLLDSEVSVQTCVCIL